MKRFALAGNPNCGKTSLFNLLTGSTAHVGNWPGVTVDKKEGTYKKLEEPIHIIDLPGIYSLSPYTPEEVISRNYILEEKPDCVINIVDATNLERNLYLTTQLLEIDVPLVVALNMMDVITKKGDKIDVEQIEKKLGVPVVPISALKGTGGDELMKRAYEASNTPRKGKTVLNNSSLAHLIGDVTIALEYENVENPLFHAVKLAENDELEVNDHAKQSKMVEDFKKTFKDDTFGTDFEAIVADERYKYLSKEFKNVYTKKEVEENDKKNKKEKITNVNMTKSDKIDKVLTHKIWGIPIFLVILFLIFHLTFSSNFLFLGAFIKDDWVSFANTPFEGIFGEGGINSPGVVLQNLLGLLTDSITTWVGNGLASIKGCPEWVQGFICDGVLSGLFAVLSFLPQILVLFLFFSILEDSGYMARVAFILDRAFRKFGLSGRAFMPMIMGFGCSVPAMINTRTLADDNERTATVRVIPYFSCGAKLPILTAVAGAIVANARVGNADIITYSMYLLGMVVAILSILLMRNTTMKGEVPPFIMELPAYHAPQFKNLMLHLWDKTKHFVKKAFTIILASTIIVWFLSHFTWSWKFLPDSEIDNSILASIGQLLQPIFTPLGFGSQLKQWGWVFGVAAIIGLIAKENVIGCFGTLAACIAGVAVAEDETGITYVQAMIAATGITVPALISFIAFNMTTIPCFAAVATAKAELSSKKKFNYTILFWLATSFIVSTIIYLIGSWWWTSFIVLAIAAIVITIIVINNKKQKASAY